MALRLAALASPKLALEIAIAALVELFQIGLCVGQVLFQTLRFIGDLLLDLHD